MRIALIGAGAIGGSIAACIAKQGYDLTVVAKYEEYASLIDHCLYRSDSCGGRLHWRRRGRVYDPYSFAC